jgi:hypothetical protein
MASRLAPRRFVRRNSAQARGQVVGWKGLAARATALELGRLILLVRGRGHRPGDRTLRLMRYGWGNTNWSADLGYLQAVAEMAGRDGGGIVEAGSGLTTVLMSYITPKTRTIASIEHLPAWADRVDATCRKRPGQSILRRDLRSFDDYDWYDVDVAALPADVGLVVCDGPPGTTRGGRFGAVPRLMPVLSPDCEILLDDAERPAEAAILDKWAADGFEYALTVTASRAYAVCRRPSTD